MRPHSRSTLSTSPAACAGSETSHWMDRPFAPMAASVSAAASALRRQAIATRYPRDASANAHARPMPRAPPVIKATLASGMLGILFVEKLFQRREIIENRGGVHLLFSADRFQRLGPWTAHAHLEHCGEFRARRLVGVNRATMQRTFVSGFLAQRAMKLELQNVGQEISRVRRARRHVILRAGIEIDFRALHRRRHALVFRAQFPPRLVVVGGFDLTGENFPPPLIDQQPERQKRDL